MVRTAYVGSAETFFYTAKGNATGQTCLIRVVKSSDGTKTVDDATMTEVDSTNAPGVYYYAWTPSATDNYAVFMFQGSLSSPTWLQTEQCEVLGAEAAPSTATYTTAAYVASFLGLRAADGTRLTFGTGTLPTLTEVNLLIRRAQDEIDGYTGHAWRSTTVTNEYHDYFPARDIGPYDLAGECRAVKLNHRTITTLATGSGDKIEVWDGSTWADYVTTKTEGRASDFWVDYTNGVLYFRSSYPTYTNKAVRVTYRYGTATIPEDIQQAATLLVAAQLMSGEAGHNISVEGLNGMMGQQDKIRMWRKQAYGLLKDHKEIKGVW